MESLATKAFVNFLPDSRLELEQMADDIDALMAHKGWQAINDLLAGEINRVEDRLLYASISDPVELGELRGRLRGLYGPRAAADAVLTKRAQRRREFEDAAESVGVGGD